MQHSIHTTNLAATAHVAGHQVIRALPHGKASLAVAESGRHVVIKPLDPGCLVAGDLHPEIRGRLTRVREIAVPGIGNLISVERDGDHVHLIWEWIEGQSLEDWLSSNPQRERRLLAAREIILLVESLHAAGIVHGALHGRNVIRDPRGKWWLTHLSPLLMSDVEQDVEAFAAILRRMLHDDAPRSASLRQMRLSLSGLIDARDDGAPANRLSESRLRRWAWIAAIAVALLAAAVSFAIWSYARL